MLILVIMFPAKFESNFIKNFHLFEDVPDIDPESISPDANVQPWLSHSIILVNDINSVCIDGVDRFLVVGGAQDEMVGKECIGLV